MTMVPPDHLRTLSRRLAPEGLGHVKYLLTRGSVISRRFLVPFIRQLSLLLMKLGRRFAHILSLIQLGP